ncbi:uncharacterized protein K452DRAFT_239485 [Aplosporella prunicola CBS 121167]|uniref:Uncharacterized protein n=1 Tax=Aplosporella prunicola CBS 121167 TaxID=1176127 RepID=A0A6A6AW18_9PEZI|nr:uncharacterized protein K452DRAFT_239485 [Aplosporella prunicola CBS 121167]KAF2135383.1 hypothetical protein K452DRAFT_239485 [Aplosporella prunicola CBS 121167]
MPSFWLSDTQKIGVAFCSGGGFFLLAGVMMFFDRALLAMGNILFLLGLTLLIGLQKTALFFARRQKLAGTASFAAGIALILLRWAFVGFCFELYGIFVLFGDFFATIAGFVRPVPVVGPYVAGFLERVSGGRRNAELPV